MPPLWARQALLGPELPTMGRSRVPTLVQDGLPSYSWEDLHFLLWLKPSPHFYFPFGEP